ncbi:amidohydrolase [Hysterangium stoloniferum]|nr:amidohydrolase [Hysterangium stoloniferum]
MAPRNEEHKLNCFPPFRPLLRRIRHLSRSQQPVDESQTQLILSSKGSIVTWERAVTEKERIAGGELLPLYSSGNEENTFLSAAVLETMEARVDELDGDLRKLSLQIHEHPELMFQEKFAHDTLTKYMVSQGFTVTPHYLGLETAWRASFKHGAGGPVLGVNSEMDALPGIGHACGHNLIAIAGVGVALGVKAALVKHDIAGEVVLLGTPAEEGGGGKIILLDRGGYADMDACIMCHPAPGPNGYFVIGPSFAMQSLDVEFFGRTAHAAAPWEGINALDAAVLAYSSISALRQQIKPQHRIHGIIEGKNWAVNVIPDYAKLNYVVRAPIDDEVDGLSKRIMACFEAAALATGCTFKITPNLPYKELSNNLPLTREFTRIATERYGMVFVDIQEPGASTDFVSCLVATLPALHPGYSIPAVSANHTIGFTAASHSEEAHVSTLRIIKTLAATGILLCSNKKFLQEACNLFPLSRLLSY